MKKNRIVVSLVCILLAVAMTAGCAMKANPQVDSETTWKLNMASQLNDAQRDYMTFFKDLGDAKRAHQVSDEQVGTLMTTGDKIKEALDGANTLFLAYNDAPSKDKKDQIIALVLQAESLLLKLSLNQGGKSL